jgi:predicted nucleic acid-binding protein
VANKRVFQAALARFATSSLSFADAYNASYMDVHGIDQIYTWDEDFDHVPGITRREPGETD